MKKCDCGRMFSPASSGNGQKMCKSCVTNRRRFALKQKAIDYLGGCCIDCGYNKCIQALEFDHIDPSLKEFAISGKHCLSWDKIKSELDKCELRCANCHRERHAKEQIVLEYTIEEHLKTTTCATCGIEFIHIKSDNRKFCSINCSNRDVNRIQNKRTIHWPEINEIITLVEKSSFTRIAGLIGVSDNGLRKYLIRNNINPKSIRSVKDNKFVRKNS